MNSIASINFRRYASLNEQMRGSFSNLNNFLFGISFAGQRLFWGKRGEYYIRHASMDFFDFFFKYGLIGLILFIMILFKNYRIMLKKRFTKEGIIIGLFLLYAFFGGHVIDSVTSGSLFYYFLAKIKS